MQNSRIGWRKRLAASIACALVAALSFSGMEMTASADEQTDGSQAQGVHAVNNADVPVIEPDSPEAKLYSLPDEAADDDSEDATADDAEEDYDPEDFFADAAPLAVNGQDRSAGVTVGGSKFSRADGLWTLSQSGEVLRVKYENGKYTPVESRDIPFYTRSCSSPYTLSGNNGDGLTRGIFDGLAVSDADGSTMYAVHSYSNATQGNEVDDAHSGVSVYRYKNGNWSTWKLVQSGSGWAMQETPVRWNGNCSSGRGSVTANYRPDNVTNKGAASERNYTFDYARTSFNSGTVINAGTQNEAYIFGGTDGSQFVGTKQHSVKMFAFLPNQGIVRYLGYLPIYPKQVPGGAFNGPQSVFADFTTDANGNVYVAVGQGFKGGGENGTKNLNLQVYRLSKQYVINEIDAVTPTVPGQAGNPAAGAQFDFSSTHHWGGSYNFNNAGCGTDGGFEAGQDPCTRPIRQDADWAAQQVVNNDLKFPYNVDGLSGIAIAPGGHVSVGVKFGNGGTHGAVVEIDENEQLIPSNKIKWYNSYEVSVSDIRKTGGFPDYEHTDIEGVLYNPPSRTLKLKKYVNGRLEQDQFAVDLNPLQKSYQKGDTYRLSQHLTKFSYGTTVGTEDIGKLSSIPDGVFVARIGERGYSNGSLNDANKFVMTDRYTSTLTCTGDIEITADKYDTVNKNRYFDITVPENATGDLECTLTNTGKQPKVYKNITVRKLFTLAKPGDVFNVGLQVEGEHNAITKTTRGLSENHFHNMVTDKRVQAGATVTLYDDAQIGELTQYNRSVRCYNTQTNADITVDRGKLVVPSDGGDNIYCDIENRAKDTSKTVRVHKYIQGRYNDGDNFTVTASVDGSNTQVSVTTTGSRYDHIQTDISSGNNATPLATTLRVPSTGTFTVSEIALNGASLSNYDVDITCLADNNTNYPMAFESSTTTSKTFRANQSSSDQIDCWVVNKNHPKATRTLTFEKVFKNTDGISGFRITTSVGRGSGKVDFSMENTADAQEVPGQPQGQHKIILGTPKSPIGDGPIPINVYEFAKFGGGYNDLSEFDVSLTCSAAGQNPVVIYGEQNKWTHQSWNTVDGSLPANLTGDVTCTLTNDLQRPKINVVLYKELKPFNQNDAFNVGLATPAQTNAGGKYFINPTSTKNVTAEQQQHDGHSVYKLGEYEYTQSNAAFDFRVEESKDFTYPPTDFSNYTTSLTCKAVDPATGSETEVFSKSDSNIDNGKLSILGQLPANQTGKVNCYLRNTAKPKVKVVLYKDLKREGSTDYFKVSMSEKPDVSSDAWKEIIAPVWAQNNQLSEQSYRSLAEGYSRYQIGTHTYIRQSGKGFTFKVEETANINNVLNKYDSDLTCKYVANRSETEDAVQNVNVAKPDVNGKRSITGVIPAGDTDAVVHCYLTNTPKPKTKVVLYKQLPHSDTNKFWVGLTNPDRPSDLFISGQTESSAKGTVSLQVGNSAKTATYDQYKIGEYEYLPTNDGFKVRVQEAGVGSAKVSSYDPKVVCKAVNGQQETNIDANLSVSSSSNNFVAIDGTIPANQSGEVHCYLRNDPKTKVVLYKQLNRFNPSDEFTVGLYSQSGQAFNGAPPIETSTATAEKLSNVGEDHLNYDQYRVGEHEFLQSADGFKFKFQEWAKDNADISNYNKNLFCQVYDYGQRQWKDFGIAIENVHDLQNGISADVTIPTGINGEVHCYFQNKAKPKGSITIHKVSSIGEVDLAGSQWKVQQKIGKKGTFKDYGIIADNDTTAQGQIHDDDSHAGYIKIANLQVGTQAEPITYKVIETVAPAGFTISDDAASGIEVTLDGTSEHPKDQELKITNSPAEVPDLPFTGGLGTIPYMLGGLSVLLGAIAVTTLTGGKRRKQN